VPAETKRPARNDGVKAWDEASADEKRVFTRLQSPHAGIARLTPTGIWRG